MAERDAFAVPAPAKVNLYLHVVGRRADGFHLLDSLIVFAGIGDTVEVRPSSALTFTVDGPMAAGVPATDNNLVLKAARALAAAAGIEAWADIRLIKRLPMAAGVGGGSADAAAVLRALRRLWRIDIADAALAKIALGLGADVPVCLAGRAAFVGGIGEAIDSVPPLPRCWIVLVNPGVPASTPAVFKARHGAFSAPARFAEVPADAAAFAALLQSRRNDLTAAALTVAPDIGKVLDALERCPGILLARMSGSGATCFGLFGDSGAATEAASALNRGHPDWWAKAGSMETDATRLEA